MKPDPASSASVEPIPAPPRWFTSSRIIPVVVVLALAATGWWFFKEQEDQMHRSAAETLRAIVELKSRQIQSWRRERLVDAQLIRVTPYVARRALDAMAQPESGTTRRMFTAVLDPLLTGNTYHRAMLVDAELKVRLVHPEQAPQGFCPELLGPAGQALRSQQPVLADLHKGDGGRRHHFSLIIPLMVRREGAVENVPAAGTAASALDRSAGVLILETDAEDFLFPLLQSWPSVSASAETLLVQREGDSVLFLNELRHRTNAALQFKVPMSLTNLPAVMVVQGQRDIVRGRDYRGVEVFAAVQPIPDSPWFLIAKQDVNEVLAPWRIRSRLMLALLAASFGALVAVGAGLWLGRQRSHYRALYRAEYGQRTLEQRNAIILQSIGDAVISTDAAGRVVSLNPAAESLTGWTIDAARGRPVEDILRIVHEGSSVPVENLIRRILRHGLAEGLSNHTCLIAQDGTAKPIATSGAPMHSPDGTLTGVVMVLRDQTEVRRAADSLQDSANFIRSTLDSLTAHIAILDQHGAILSVNRAWRRFAEENPPVHVEVCEGANYLAICDAVPHEDEPTARLVADGIRAVLNGQQNSFDLEYSCHSPHQQRWFVARVTRFAGDGPPRAVVAHENVTARKRAEEKVLQSEERFRRAVVHSPFPIVLHAEDGEILQASESWCDITGYTREELATIEDWTERAYGERKHQVRADIDALYALDHRKHEGDYVIRTRDGDRLTWEFSSAPLGRLADGRRLVISMAQDVTERRRAEAALVESEERYRLLLENSMDAILLTVPNGPVLQANRAACVMFGRTEEELKQTGRAGVICEDDPRLAAALAERERTGRFVGELTLQRRDGSRFPAELSSTIFLDHEGRARTSMIIRDTTARKRAEDSLRAALAEQTALLKEVHHRVKNNLQIVVSLLNLQAGQVTNEIARETLRDTQNRIRSLALLHETLYRQGTAARAVAAVYFDTLCEHLRQSFGANARQIQIEKHIAAVELDLDQAIPCGLMVNELVTNAIKHAFPDGRPGRILLELRAEGKSTLTLTVADDGVGLPANLDLRQQGGTLGLRLIGGLAAQIGGTLETTNNPGAIFRITFPYSPEPKETLV